MKKKVLCLAMALVMLAGGSLTAHAEELKGQDGWRAEFNGKKIVSNFDSGTLADEAGNVQPGDSITLKVEIKNSDTGSTDWYMTNEAIQSLEDAAEAPKGYSYQVTLHAGNQGTIGGQDSVTISDLQYGAQVSFDLSTIQVTDDRYYVKGVRLSGRDNNTVNATAFRVEGDADYVVAYGIKGNLVAYTVKYQDASGRQLAADSTFYGNVGDKPIVAYRYIENYVPQALALTKTLSANEAENVFTFVYTRGEAGIITIPGSDTTNVVTVVVPGVTRVNGGGASAGGNGAGGGAAAGADANGGAAGEGDNDDNDDNVEVTTPDNLVDLDENQAPAANIDLDGNGAKAFPFAAAVVIGVGALAALLVLAVWIRKRMKSEE